MATQVKGKQTSADKSLQQLQTRLCSIEERLSDVGETRSAVQALQNEVSSLPCQINSQALDFKDLENRSRKNDLTVRRGSGGKQNRTNFFE